MSGSYHVPEGYDPVDVSQLLGRGWRRARNTYNAVREEAGFRITIYSYRQIKGTFKYALRGLRDSGMESGDVTHSFIWYDTAGEAAKGATDAIFRIQRGLDYPDADPISGIVPPFRRGPRGSAGWQVDA